MSEPAPDEERDGDQPQGRILPTRPGVLALAGVLGFILGWALRPLGLRLGYVEPPVTLTSLGLLFFVALLVGVSAYATRRTVRRDRFALAHHQAVNRLALGKACAVAGAFLAGGYLGYAVAQLGVGSPAADTRLWRSGVAALGALAVMVAALLLEQACRVPPRDD